ncbi:NAD-dependent epimerase/dehydratase family protein [Kitasatospora sp. NBC_01250]|uniref:NAD-dependent epimerase/dehydratase family protein n=1 Tax=unclassified Kitasatospora TaxID=2633591 RepID=UPI002E1090BE|nr:MULTISPECIES: NAD-dependent epimerase/dehydratase family protein [unclassified Kitasatospora]WSJ70522.1 NAD-dependent epimerase/dehydratase family protein [Kitasatospora sp. NBC_01302]
MRVVVTGGAGFIGANLVAALLERPEVTEVRVVDDLTGGAKADLAGCDATLYDGSILDPGLLDAAFAGADAVVHLAALPSVPRSVADPLASHEVNTTGTLQVLEAARRAGGLYVAAASSSSVYGANRELPKRETMRAEPLSPYAVSKLAAEGYLAAYHHCYGLDVLPLRLFNVFGPLQPAGHAYAAVVPSFVAAALAGRPLTVHGDGRQSRDFTYVGTVARVFTEAVVRRVVHPAPVNVALGTRTTLLELVDELAAVLGRPLEVTHSGPRAGDVRDSVADDALLRSLFPGLAPVPLRVGLERTVEWFRTRPAA